MEETKMSKEQIKETVYLVVNSGDFSVEVLTNEDLKKYAEENELDADDLSEVVSAYMDEIDDGSQAGWSELDLSTPEDRQIALDEINKLKAVIERLSK
jgi:hypothetical protein